ncbi:hypothetical protein Plhal304r1_c015g0054951 [Plasmopara halstedii]
MFPLHPVHILGATLVGIPVGVQSSSHPKRWRKGYQVNLCCKCQHYQCACIKRTSTDKKCKAYGRQPHVTAQSSIARYPNPEVHGESSIGQCDDASIAIWTVERVAHT